MIFAACTEIDPLGVANGVPEGYDPSVVPVTGVTLNKDTTSIILGNTEKLTATIEPEDATNKAITWSTSDENIATVSEDGLVTSVGAGEAVITVTSDADADISAECNVTIAYDNDWIYFVEESTVSKMRLDGTGVESVFTLPFVDTSKIQLDSLRQKLYVFNHFTAITNQIYEYNLDGTGQRLIADTDTSDIGDIALDHINGYLYYVWSGGIVRINLDDTSIKDNILTLGLGVPSYVAPDYKGGVYYFYNAGIYKVATDTTSIQLDPITPTAPTVSCKGLYSDSTGAYLYYYDFEVIMKVAVATKTSSGVLDTGNSIISNMVLYQPGSKIFFQNEIGGAPPYNYIISSINMDGSGYKEVLNNSTSIITTFDILAK